MIFLTADYLKAADRRGAGRLNHLSWQGMRKKRLMKGWRAITVYPQPYRHWQWACKYYPVLPNLLHNGALTHLPEAPTFTSGFAGAWVGVAASRKVLIYKADSGLVRWARWPKGLRSHWPEEAQGRRSLSGVGGWLASRKQGGETKGLLLFFFYFFFFFSLPYFFSLSLRKPWWEFH